MLLSPIPGVMGRLAAVFFFSLYVPQWALAITIDEFNGVQQVVAQSQGGAAFSVTSVSEAIGGTRTLAAQVTSVGQGQTGTLDVVVQSGTLSHSQTSTVRGTSSIVWDGDLDSTSINPQGLGGIDLTQDGATALELDVISFDLPGGLPVTIWFRVYDASDSSGDTYSEGQVSINQVISSLTAVELPFSGLTVDGPSGPADIQNVGAISLFVDGSNPNIDLTFEWMGTNGTCRRIPDINGSVFDECGVCGGDNSTCADCQGVPNGPDIVGASCNTGLSGVCEQGSYNKSCTCVGTFDPSPEFCDGVDNDCDGSVDEQYPLLGTNCGAGEGDCKISGIYVCGSDGQLECDADFNLADYEKCSEIIGCDGIPGSELTYDECGICGGPGGSCDQCTPIDVTLELFALDSNSKAQERLVRKITKKIVKLSRTAKNLAFADSFQTQARALHISNWGLSWSMPRVINDCVESVECVSLSNQSTIDIYRSQTDDLRRLAIKAARKFRRVSKNIKQYRRFIRRAKNLSRKSLASAAIVPLSHTQCS